MNAIKLCNLLGNVRGSLAQVLADQATLEAYVADTPLAAKAAALMPAGKKAALLAVVKDYADVIDVVTERINNIDANW